MRVLYYFTIVRKLPPEMRKNFIRRFKVFESSGLKDPFAVVAAIYRNTHDVALRAVLEEFFDAEVKRPGAVWPL